MTSSDPKVEKVQKHFAALSSVASSLNEASNELTKVVSTLDEALKKLNVGLTVWVTYLNYNMEEADAYSHDQIGYCKMDGEWGIALRHLWGYESSAEGNMDGPWLFKNAPREMRIRGVDKIPELIEALGKEAFDTTKKIQDKTKTVGELAVVVGQIAKEHEARAHKDPFPAITALEAMAKARK
jgi:hypothetical protein